MFTTFSLYVAFINITHDRTRISVIKHVKKQEKMYNLVQAYYIHDTMARRSK